MKKLMLISTTGAFLTTLFSCQKCVDEPFPDYEQPQLGDSGLPVATTSGEHSFGCLINGVRYVPFRENGFGSAYNIDCNLSESDYLSIRTSRILNGVPEIGLNLSAQISDTLGRYSLDAHYWAEYEECFVVTDTTAQNYIEITAIDSLGEFISGFFHVQFVPLLCEGDTIICTDGRFDARID